MEYTGLNRDHKLLFIVRGIPVKGRRFGKNYTRCFDTEITSILLRDTLKMLYGSSFFYRVGIFNVGKVQ